MTEYGRGYRSEPWHPEDPLYGDQGSYGGHAQHSPWGGRGAAPAPPRYDGGWDGAAPGGAPYDPYGTQQPHDPLTGPYVDPYAAPAGYPSPQAPQGYVQNPGQPYDQGSYEQQYPHDQRYPQDRGYPQDQGYAGQPGYPQEQQYPYDPQYPHDPAYGERPQQPYPPHDQGPVPQAAPRTDEPEDDWRPDGGREPDPDHAFFADDPADDRPDADDEDERAADVRSGHEGRGKKTKRRGGCARFLIAVVIAAGVGGAGYVGYRFYESHIASPRTSRARAPARSRSRFRTAHRSSKWGRSSKRKASSRASTPSLPRRRRTRRVRGSSPAVIRCASTCRRRPPWT